MTNKYDDIVQRIGSFGIEQPRPPLSEEQLKELEAWHGYALPADYREFLRDYGGIGAKASYPLKDSRRKGWDGGIFVFFDIMSHQAREELESGMNTIELEVAPAMTEVLHLAEGATEVDDPPRELIGIAIDRGGNQVYLSLGGRQPGAVYLWLNWEDIYFVADSFDEFMQSLYPTPENEYE